MAQRRINGGARRCRVLERIWSPCKVSTDAVAAVFEECGWLLSAWSPEASSARSQGKPKMAVRIAGGSEVCLNGCSSITECTRIMGPAPSERQKKTYLWG